MPIRFRKSYKIAPGVRINLNKKSVGFSIGSKRAGVTFNSRRGATGRVSFPFGVTYTTKLSGSRGGKRRSFRASNSNNSVLDYSALDSDSPAPIPNPPPAPFKPLSPVFLPETDHEAKQFSFKALVAIPLYLILCAFLNRPFFFRLLPVVIAFCGLFICVSYFCTKQMVEFYKKCNVIQSALYQKSMKKYNLRLAQYEKELAEYESKYHPNDE